VHLNEKWNHREQREIEAGILSSNDKSNPNDSMTSKGNLGMG